MAALVVSAAALSSCASTEVKDEGKYTLHTSKATTPGVDRVGASVGVYAGYASADFKDSRRISGLAQ